MQFLGLITGYHGITKSTDNLRNNQKFKVNIKNITTGRDEVYKLKSGPLAKTFDIVPGRIYLFNTTRSKIIQGELMYESIDDYKNGIKTNKSEKLKELSIIRLVWHIGLLSFIIILLKVFLTGFF